MSTFCTQLCPHKQCYSLGIVRANEIRLAFDSGKGNCLNYSSNLISSNEKNITKYTDRTKDSSQEASSFGTVKVTYRYPRSDPIT